MNLLIDLNQVLLSGITCSIKPNEKITEKDITLISLGILRTFRKKFKSYKNVIICCDAKTYWRKTYFPNYKQHRKANREKDKLDWDTIFKALNKLKEDLKTYFPYIVLEIDGAEADDIIGVLTPYLSEYDPVLILSADGDFIQLQRYKNVKQYSPKFSAYITEKHPLKKLKEKIIRGDSNDGIPNVLSNDNVFVIKKRQTGISSEKLPTWLELNPKDFLSEEQYRNYIRNDILINFDNIPENIREEIIDQYNKKKMVYTKGNNKEISFNNLREGNNSKLYDYILENKLPELLEVIDEF